MNILAEALVATISKFSKILQEPVFRPETQVDFLLGKLCNSDLNYVSLSPIFQIPYMDFFFFCLPVWYFINFAQHLEVNKAPPTFM